MNNENRSAKVEVSEKSTEEREIRSNSHLYGIWCKQLAQLVISKYQKYQVTNLVLLVVGIFKAKSVHLSVIARQLPIRAKKLSLMKRLERFLANPVFRVRE